MSKQGVFPPKNSVQELHTGSPGNSHLRVWMDRPLSWTSRGVGGKHYTKNRAVLCTWHFHPTFRAASGPSGGCIQQNLVPRPKAPQGSWVASRGCCGALAAASPPQRRPRPHSCRFLEHAPDEDGGRSSGRSKTRNTVSASAAAAAGAVEESAGACSPLRSSKLGRG